MYSIVFFISLVDLNINRHKHPHSTHHKKCNGFVKEFNSSSLANGIE